ncbi:MFS transporter [Allobranchiibius sp. CTAmp26]|uniref:MFS transporter n=1 Tax=Allobranchiibius sp. CTAmp26 TaxID=2815214 RepID=UPI0027DCA911|nr:MFS transporter [Allobranchiibius sp. CTAmp26]
MRSPALLRQVGFRRFFIGQSVSLLGDQFAVLAVPLAAILTVGAGATQVGVLTAAGVAPSLLLSVWAGAWIDRHGHRRVVMLVADFSRAAAVLSIPIAYAFGGLTLIQLYLVAFLVGVFDVFFGVAYQAVLISMVRRDQYVAASSWLRGSEAVTQTVGLTLGGVLVSVLTAPVALVFNAASFAISGAQLARIHPAEPGSAKSAHGQGVGEGLRWVYRSALMRAVLTSSGLTNLAVFMSTGVLTLYAIRTLHLTPTAIGVALGAGAVGAFIGAATCARVETRLGLGRLLAFSSLIYPAGLLFYPAARGPALLAASTLAAGEFIAAVTAVWADIALGTILAIEVADDIRSRVNGVFRTINQGVRPIGAVAGGLLATWIGLRSALLCSALIGLLGGSLILRKQVLSMKSNPPSPKTPTTD